MFLLYPIVDYFQLILNLNSYKRFPCITFLIPYHPIADYKHNQKMLYPLKTPTSPASAHTFLPFDTQIYLVFL